ncbi:MAG: 50S ribosomal protein L23 [Nannocystaceae bacterium]|nr:50S ribosomal protein L23 [Nannocystaceae bacterium]
MITPHQVIVRPIVTEKSNDLVSANNQYVFEVHKDANKIEIRSAVEMVFGVRVQAVRTQMVRSDLRRVGRFYGRKPAWKKAIVTLHAEDSIDLYGEES